MAVGLDGHWWSLEKSKLNYVNLGLVVSFALLIVAFAAFDSWILWMFIAKMSSISRYSLCSRFSLTSFIRTFDASIDDP